MDNLVMNMNRNDKFLKKAYLKNLFPIMFSVLGGTINALVDSILVSQKLGVNGLAAVNLCTPVYLLLCTLGALIASGAHVLSAQAMGKEDMKRANQYFHTALLVCVISGIAITILGVLFFRPISFLLTQEGELAGIVYEYAIVSLIGAVFFILIYLPLFYLQLEGKAKHISIMIFIMVSADIILDYVLMFVFEFGLYGAAAASVISSAAAGFYGLFILIKYSTNYSFHKEFLRMKNMGAIIKNGSPIALGNFYDAIRLLLINAVILKAGGPKGVAVWAVLNIFSELSLCISSGVPQAAAPTMGVYYSSSENSGIRILVRLQTRMGIAFSGIFALIIMIGHPFIENLFDISENLLFPLMCLGLSIIGNVLGSIWTILFNVTEKIALSNLITCFRRLLCPVLAILIAQFFAEYIWLFLPFGSLLALGIGYLTIAIRAKRSQYEQYVLSVPLLLDDHLEREHKVLDFSINADMNEACSASEQIKDFCMSNKMDKKKIIRMGLAIEELIGVLIEKNPDARTLDLRAYALKSSTGIQIRFIGDMYNPFSKMDEDDETYMGIAMLQKMASDIKYTYALGINTINISFE